jgi:hypothetical protein
MTKAVITGSNLIGSRESRAASRGFRARCRRSSGTGTPAASGASWAAS